MKTTAAAIDLGTNTARLLIGYRDPAGMIEPLLVKRWITRLGGGFSKELGISTEAKKRTIAALKDFAMEIKKYGVVRVRAVATSAVRDAVNGSDFQDRVLKETGIDLQVVDEQPGLVAQCGCPLEVQVRRGFPHLALQPGAAAGPATPGPKPKIQTVVNSQPNSMT